jgi:alpha-ketoglutarate-dependent taurine dioxygenase
LSDAKLKERTMIQFTARVLSPALGADIVGFDPKAPLDNETRTALQHLFDTQYLLRFRDIDLTHAEQFWLTTMLIGQDKDGDAPRPAPTDNFYVSNRRPDSAAPHGRLQFHSDTMWADDPFEVLSLYGLEIEQPAAPTSFVSGVAAWKTLPENLRRRIEGLRALHTAGAIRRRDLTDVLEGDVEDPPTAIQPLSLPHKRTGEPILYASEQVTREIVAMPADESEDLLNALFDHLYQPAHQWEHDWHERDLVVWDDFAIQHARKNVAVAGPVRTLRKVAHPIPTLTAAQKPVYAAEV